jgi:HAD superfamily hydrolase (TIGR01549 family)
MDKNISMNKDAVFPKKKLILFDLDGVIIDSKPNMAHSWSVVQERFSIDTPFESYFSNIGRPFPEIIQILGHSDQALEIEKVYKKASLELLGKIKVYDGVHETLALIDELGYKMGIVTSKDKARTDIVLRNIDLDFDIVRTPDNTCRGKPCPDHLLYAVAMLNVDPSESIFVGDMEVDYLAAKRANIDFFHAKWGYSPSTIHDAVTLNSFHEILTFI